MMASVMVTAVSAPKLKKITDRSFELDILFSWVGLHGEAGGTIGSPKNISLLSAKAAEELIERCSDWMWCRCGIIGVGGVTPRVARCGRQTSMGREGGLVHWLLQFHMGEWRYWC